MRFPFSTQFIASSTGSRRLLSAVALAALALSASPSAQAHIKLMEPPSWLVEDVQGGPDQKTAPCGTVASTTQSGMVTQYAPGETVMVAWQETVGHPGHFRISLVDADQRALLVDPPVVTANGDGRSGLSISATIMDPVAAPVLKDGLFPRENVSAGAPQAEPFMEPVTLPTQPGKYTLQVIQFMSQHGPGYFYHHCADIEIAADVTTTAAGGSASTVTGQAGSAMTGAGGSPPMTGAGGSSAGNRQDMTDDGADDEEDDDSCSFAPGSSGGSTAAAILALVGLTATLRRRRSAR